MIVHAHESLLLARVRTLVTLVLAMSLCVPVSAFAVRRASDEIAGKPASARGIRKNRLPDVSVKAGILVEANGQVLWARAPDQRRAMASITKIMTALVALEESDLDDMVTVRSDVTAPGESTAGLRPGQKLPMRELLEGLLVKSGNDAAVAIAEHVAGSEESFVAKMNAKAKELGLKGTRFTNSHGLDEPGHHTTADDLQRLAREAMKNREFRRIVGMREAKVAGHAVTSTNVLLGSYPGAIGIKTGFTDDAGHSVVAAAERGNFELYAVVLGAPTEKQRFVDARTLLDWGFAHDRPASLVSKGAYLGTVPVLDYIDTSVGAVTASEPTATIFDLRGPVKRTVKLDDGIDAPVKAGTRLGVARFVQDGKKVGEVELVAARDVPAPTLFERIGIAVTRGWRFVFGPRVQPKPVALAR